MEQNKVILSPLAKKKLRELFKVLIYKSYFSYTENADKYVEALRRFMYDVPHRKRYPTIDKTYGSWYCKYKANSHTTWYVTFDTDEKIFLVKNLFNNHTKDYPTIIKG